MKKIIAGIFALALVGASVLTNFPAKTILETSAAAETPDWLTTKGNKIVDMNGNEVWLTGVNWFGLNTQTHTFDGLWASNLYVNLELIADHGLNLLRIPVATELLLNWESGNYTTLDWEFNRGKNYYIDEENRVYDEKYDVLKDMGKTLSFDSSYVAPTDYEVFNVALKKCKELGIKVMIDIHSSEIDNMGHQWPLWYKGSITTEDYYAGLEWLTETYKNDDTIIAIDLKNEPHGKYKDGQFGGNWAIWDDSTAENNWRHVAGVAGKKVLDINPNLLIMVEGIEVYPKEGETWESPAGGYGEPENYYGAWWGGNFRGVKEYPVDLGKYQAQLVYSPHDYGPSVYDQTWFYDGFNKQTLHDDYWYDSWAYIYEDGGAEPYTTEWGATSIPKKEGAEKYTTPLLIGEWGGFVEGDADERGGASATTERNTHWLTELQHYIIENHIHHTFWCFNYNSSDTGGLMYDDFAKWNEPKYQFLLPALWQTDDGKFIGLDHDIPIGANGITLNEYYNGGGGGSTGGSETTTPKVTTAKSTTTEKITTAKSTTTSKITTAKSTTTEKITTPKVTGVPSADTLLGDVNSDEKAGTLADVIMLGKYLGNKVELDDQAKLNADCHSDTGLTSNDLIALVKLSFGEVPIGDLPL